MLQAIGDMLVLLLAAGLSSLIGLEREASHKPAGLRTHVLVGVGAALLTLIAVSSFGIPGDRSVATIISGLVTGIGFLGAGSIIASGRHVQGITTAATIWMTAILGITVGLGYTLLAVFASVLVFLVLKVKMVEKTIEKKIKA
jgi:putative Mg2+ transporter-C (MgtC) family protein